MRCPNNIPIPDNISNYIDHHHGVALVVSLNATDAVNGYGHQLHTVYELKHLTRTCHRCGYDEIWHPELWGAHGDGRHTYGNYRYDTVFRYKQGDKKPTLEQAFNLWLEAQPTEYETDKPMEAWDF